MAGADYYIMMSEVVDLVSDSKEEDVVVVPMGVTGESRTWYVLFVEWYTKNVGSLVPAHRRSCRVAP